MATQSLHSSAATRFWRLVQRQHGLITRAQLLELGLSPQAVKRRVAQGRLHRVARGTYAVGRPELTQHGRWMAAVLSCGSSAVLSHRSAAALWEILPVRHGRVDVSVPGGVVRRREGVVVRRRPVLDRRHVTCRRGIPVTSPSLTLVDIAASADRDRLPAAVNEADKRDLVHTERLRAELDELPRIPGIAFLRELLDRRTFALTDSELERRFLPLARAAGLPLPETRREINGFRVDFYWPTLGLVVETDGLRYHRTPAQQAKDRLRTRPMRRRATRPSASRTPRSPTTGLT